jgi:hypothetical protein
VFVQSNWKGLGPNFWPSPRRKFAGVGATIILPQLHFRVPALATLCRLLERRFSQRFQADIYLTPPGAQGFGTHYDNHDVFILQVAGSKK